MGNPYFWAKAKSTKDFYVASKSVSPLANGLATAADWMSGASFVAMAGGIYFKGYGYMALLVGWTGGYDEVDGLDKTNGCNYSDEVDAPPALIWDGKCLLSLGFDFHLKDYL